MEAFLGLGVLWSQMEEIMVFKTTQQKIDKLKIKIAGLEERIRLKENGFQFANAHHYLSYIGDKEKLAKLRECLRQLEIKKIKNREL